MHETLHSVLDIGLALPYNCYSKCIVNVNVDVNFICRLFCLFLSVFLRRVMSDQQAKVVLKVKRVKRAVLADVD